MISVSLVTYLTPEDEFRSCLSALASAKVGRIYVVDNASEKRISDICAEYGKVDYIANENTGYGAAHNLAIRRSMAEGYAYNLVLNTDVVFDPSLIDKMVDYADKHPETGMMHPRMLYPDGRVQYTCRRLPTPANVFFRRFFPPVARILDRKYLLQAELGDKPVNVPYIQGSFMLLRHEALKDVGLFDERFFMYAEDIDLSRRMHGRWRTVYYPDVTAIHAHRAASYHSWRMLRVHIVNMCRYFNKWGWLIDGERRRMNRKIDVIE